MINLAADQECKRGREPLLEEHPDFTLGIHLSTERRHSELVFRAQGRRRFTFTGTHGSVGRDEGLEVETDVD